MQMKIIPLSLDLEKAPSASIRAVNTSTEYACGHDRSERTLSPIEVSGLGLVLPVMSDVSFHTLLSIDPEFCQSPSNVQDPWFWLLWLVPDSTPLEALEDFSQFTEQHADKFVPHRVVNTDEGRFYACQKNHFDLAAYLYPCPRLLNDNLARFIIAQVLNIFQAMTIENFYVPSKDILASLQLWRTEESTFQLRFGKGYSIVGREVADRYEDVFPISNRRHLYTRETPDYGTKLPFIVLYKPLKTCFNLRIFLTNYSLTWTQVALSLLPSITSEML